MTLREAGRQEAGEIVRVINAAFNPAESFFVDGDRIDLEQVLHYFEKGVFLVAAEPLAGRHCASGAAACTNQPGSRSKRLHGEMSGCVYVELRGERAYFGLLSVDPARQKGGIGGALIAAAEEYGRAHGCLFMDLRIVNLRAELPAFYGKLGYTVAGTEEFTSGAPIKLPCHFIKMQKALSGGESATA